MSGWLGANACPHCDRRYQRIWNLATHVASKHPGTLPVQRDASTRHTASLVGRQHMEAEYTGETIDITPDWEATCEWYAGALAQHAFEKWAYSPVISFMEQVRWLSVSDPAAVQRIMDRLKAKEHGFADDGRR